MKNYQDSMPDVADELAHKYLVFAIDESYAVELANVLEIIEFKDVTRVPETPDYIAGVTNRQGSVLPVIDMRKRFHKDSAPEDIRRCIVVIRYEDMKLGLLVDSVSDLCDIGEEKISPPPQVGPNYAHVFIKAIGIREEEMVMIIDTNTLINHRDLQALEEGILPLSSLQDK